MSDHVLPDSRLNQRPDLGCVMVDWLLTDGSTVRLEAQPIFCANCGVDYGYVPKDCTAFVFWLCNTCFWAYGSVAGTYAKPDDDFQRDVATELSKRFGKESVTAAELACALGSSTDLGPALAALERDSVFRNTLPR